MAYDLNLARTVLTDIEKDRLVCLFLTLDTKSTNAQIDWQSASDALGNASVESLRVSTRNTLNKIKVGNASHATDQADRTPTPSKPKSTPKKRKATGDNDQVDSDVTTPAKKRGRKPKSPVQEQSMAEIKTEGCDQGQQAVDFDTNAS